MEAKRYGKMLAIALLGGILGGILSHSFSATVSAMTQATQGDKKVVKAQEFLVVDSHGRVRARFGMETISGVMSTSPTIYSINKEESDKERKIRIIPDESSENGLTPEGSLPYSLPDIDLHFENKLEEGSVTISEFPRIVIYDHFGEVLWQAPRGVEFLFGAES